MTPIEIILFTIGLLLLSSVILSKFSARFGVPSLLLFLAIGMAIGSEGAGGIYFDNVAAAQQIGSVALALILFDGGLSTNWRSIRPIVWRGFSLATLGVLLTGILIGGFTSAILGLTLLQGMLLGAIVSSTDAAAVFAMLGKSIGLKHNLKPLLEFESGSNDPMAIFLTMGTIQLLLNPELGPLDLMGFFFEQMVLGALIGYGLAMAMQRIINRLRLEFDGLYSVLTLGFVFFTYGIIALAGGSPFLGLYVAGLVLGNSTFIHKNSLMRFHNGLAWLMQITMFLVLGLLVFPSRLLEVAWEGVLLALFMIVVARPISVFISLARSKLGLRDKLFVSWVGLRGATPIILATFPLLAEVPGADRIFDLVFFIVITSVLIQGTTIRLSARLLGRNLPVKPQPRYPFEMMSGEGLKSELFEVRIRNGSSAVGKQILNLKLPPDTLVVLLHRDDDLVVPNGGTILEAADTLLILADTRQQAMICDLLGGVPVSETP